MNYFLREKGGFVISTDPRILDRNAVFEFLAQAKWWTELTEVSLERAIENSLCFSLITTKHNQQLGWARVITDYVTYAYLCDVFIVEEQRGRGLGSWMIRCVLEHPDLKHLKRVALITHDAQAFYLNLEFSFASDSNIYMERLQ